MFSASKCPKLQKKPKFFWIQACRVSEASGEYTPGYYDEDLYTTPSSTKIQTVNNRPELLDTLVGINFNL